MPIDLEDLGNYNPEVEEIKRKIYELAAEHSRAHHCGDSGARELRQAGISRPRRITVEVKFKVPGDDEHEHSVEVDDFNLSEFKGKSDEEQKELAAAHLQPALTVGESNVDVNIKLDILDLSIVQEGAAALALPSGYRYMITSGGRVAHAVNFNNHAVCGDIYVYMASEAAKGTSICKKCQTRVKNLVGADTKVEVV